MSSKDGWFLGFVVSTRFAQVDRNEDQVSVHILRTVSIGPRDCVCTCVG